MHVERDARELIHVSGEERFYRFLVARAARTGNVLNVSDLSRDAGAEAPAVDTVVVSPQVAAYRFPGLG